MLHHNPAGASMADNEVTAELMAMRAQLQQLEQERHRQQASPTPASVAIDSQMPAAEEAQADKDWLDELKELEGLDPEQVLERLKDSIGEWLGELNSELKDIKPSTLLLVLGLGVLVGRLTK
jgi:hypothetical protein